MTAVRVPTGTAVDHWPSGHPATAVGSSCAVDVWFADLDRPPLPFDDLVAVLDRSERRRASAFAFPADSRRFVAARGLLRLLLAADTGEDPAALSLRAGPCGKPELATRAADGPLRFNHSRSGGSALYAVSRRGRVGVDLEASRPVPEALTIARQWCTPSERMMLATLQGRQRAEAFLRLWVAKEADAKARGHGLTDDVRDLHVAPWPQGRSPSRPIAVGAGEVAAAEATSWVLHLLPPLPGFAAALVIEGDREPPRCHRLDADPRPG